ncbi:MAG: OmpH family outer membrane protein [Planctomycetia bacterium]|nr:OmpH family outer membrane protein [Planctomycetia bacterium]
MMKTIFSALLATIVLSMAAPAFAQQPAQPHPQVISPIAILDLPYLFRNHNRFKQMDEVLKQEIGGAEGTFMTEQKAMKEMVTRLQELKQGTPEYKQLEEELAKRDADMSLRINIMKKNFAEKKAKNYFDVYQEVMRYVGYHAQNNGVVLVINFNGDPVDGSNPQSVIQGLNSTVLYKHPGVDITPIVLEMCNRGLQIPETAQNPAANPAFPVQR